MKVTKMQLSELKRPEKNIRLHTEKQIKEFERSVAMFGQIRPIVVDDDNVILAGNGLYETLLHMGWKEADVYKVIGLSEAQKKKLMIADNKIYGLGIDDLDTFDEFLNDLKDDLDIPGFDEDLLKTMVAEADEISDTLSEYGKLDDDEISSMQTARENIPSPQQVPQQVVSPAQEKASDGGFVICPECGAKVWL